MRFLKKLLNLSFFFLFTFAAAGPNVNAENYNVNVLIVGKSGVGKKLLASRLCDGSMFDGFEVDRDMLRGWTKKVSGIDLRTYNKTSCNYATYYFEDCTFNLKIRIKDIDHTFDGNICRGYNIVIYVFDIKEDYNEESVDCMVRMHDEIKRKNPINNFIVLVGNKVDLLDNYVFVKDIISRPLVVLDETSFVPCSVTSGRNLDGVLLAILDWGPPHDFESPFCTNCCLDTICHCCLGCAKSICCCCSACFF